MDDGGSVVVRCVICGDPCQRSTVVAARPWVHTDDYIDLCHPERVDYDHVPVPDVIDVIGTTQPDRP